MEKEPSAKRRGCGLKATLILGATMLVVGAYAYFGRGGERTTSVIPNFPQNPAGTIDPDTYALLEATLAPAGFPFLDGSPTPIPLPPTPVPTLTPTPTYAERPVAIVGEHIPIYFPQTGAFMGMYDGTRDGLVTVVSCDAAKNNEWINVMLPDGTIAVVDRSHLTPPENTSAESGKNRDFYCGPEYKVTSGFPGPEFGRDCDSDGGYGATTCTVTGVTLTPGLESNGGLTLIYRPDSNGNVSNFSIRGNLEAGEHMEVIGCTNKKPVDEYFGWPTVTLTVQSQPGARYNRGSDGMVVLKAGHNENATGQLVTDKPMTCADLPAFNNELNGAVLTFSEP